MMKQLFFLLICLLKFAFTSFSQTNPNFHIYLLFGQSNMEGWATVESQDTIKNLRVRVLQDINCDSLNRTYGQWYIAEPPLNRCKKRLGPGDSFGKAMAEGTPKSITIGLVPAAISGTKIELFQKSAPIGTGMGGLPPQFNSGYEWLVDLAKIAQRSGTIKGILFHQGESNAGESDWKFKVQEIVNDLKKDLNLGDVPFLAGEMLYTEKGGDAGGHNVEVNKLPELIPNCYVISAKDLDGTDVFHFTSASYRELGKRYATRMLTLANLNLVNNVDFQMERLEISPVPFKENLNIALPQNIQEATVRMYSPDGQEVFKKTISSASKFTLNTGSFPSNIYFVEMVSGPYRIVKKIAKIE